MILFRKDRSTFFFLSAVFAFTVCTASLTAQEFGFGDGDASAAAAPTASVGGEVTGSLLGYFGDFSEGLSETRLGDIFTGKLNFSASGSNAEAFIGIKLQTADDLPVVLDEAYVRAFFGDLSVEAGLRKLTWGKADAMGPLDVINPLDYSDMTGLLDSADLKMARPLLHLAWNFGSFSKLEGVFVPWFEGSRSASSGRWKPRQLNTLPGEIIDGLVNLAPAPFQPAIQSNLSGASGSWNLSGGKDTTALDYAQAGLRFTTTIGSSDVGAQYYFGRLPQPAVICNAP